MINECQARKYCKEDLSKIKNYDLAIADTTQTWDCHHMTETWWNCTAKDLIKNECYYHRKVCELIFLTHAEHMLLHMKGKPSPRKGVTLSDETRHKISEAKKGKHHAEETKKKISEAHIGKTHSEETRRKMSESRKGRTFSEETRKKISEAQKRRWAKGGN